MIEQESQVLVIFPHPDDEAFGVSGTIATLIERETPVTYACLTLGQMGRNLGNPPFATRESLPIIRKAELQDAAKAMGLTDLRMMGLRDKTLEFEDDQKMAQMVTDLIEELNPSLIISFYPGYSVHPDHEATGKAVVRAVRALPEKERPKLQLVAFSNNCVDELGEANIIHDVSAVKEKKMNTMRAHISQTAWMLKDIDEGRIDQNSEIVKRFTQERFWNYQWDHDKVN
jgi:bacillithiol biosynthesis deacetylase BshB2